MSFSSDVKEELAKHVSSARHCQIAEFAAILRMCGRIGGHGNPVPEICIRTENADTAKKCVLLLKRAFRIEPGISLRGETHVLMIEDEEQVFHVLETLKLLDTGNHFTEREDLVSSRVIQNSCCKRAFLRGAFLAGGSITNPERSYHLEFVCSGEKKAGQLQEILTAFDIEAKTVLRKKYHVVYIKEGDQIVELLGLMEAHQALMNLENVRILKEMRGSVNRKVNCETANINKTVSAAFSQTEDIILIQNRMGFENLPDSLAETAQARLDNPDATLKELGELLDPPVGKSGVNHRLQKLKQIAERLRVE